MELSDLLRRKSLEITIIAATLGLFFGLNNPKVFVSLKATLPVAIFLMIFHPMFTLKFEAKKKRLKFLATVLTFYTILFPTLTVLYFYACKSFLSETGRLILVGAILVALAPVAMPAPTFVSIAEGDVELSLMSVILTFILSFAVIPIYSYLILKTVIRVPISLIFKSLVEYILLPFLAGQILRKFVEKKSDVKKVSKALMTTSLLALYYLIAVVFGASSNIITSRGLEVAIIAVTLFLYFGLRFTIAYVFGKVSKFSYPELVPLIYSASGNGAIGVAISLSAFGPLATTGAVLAGPLVLVVLMTAVLKILMKT